MIIIASNSDKQRLSETLKVLEGLNVTKIYRSIGTVLVFELGSQKEGYIRIELCNWKLQKDKKDVLIDSVSVEEIDKAITIFKDKKLQTIKVSSDSKWPIQLIFDDGIVLYISDTWSHRVWGLTFRLPNKNYLEIDRGYLWRVVSSDHVGD